MLGGPRAGGARPSGDRQRGRLVLEEGGERPGDPASEKGDGVGGGGRGGCHLAMGGAGDGEGDRDPAGWEAYGWEVESHGHPGTDGRG